MLKKIEIFCVLSTAPSHIFILNSFFKKSVEHCAKKELPTKKVVIFNFFLCFRCTTKFFLHLDIWRKNLALKFCQMQGFHVQRNQGGWCGLCWWEAIKRHTFFFISHWVAQKKYGLPGIAVDFFHFSVFCYFAHFFVVNWLSDFRWAEK